MEGIFISCHEDDQSVVHRLADDLTSLGQDVVFDRASEPSPEAWEATLDAIRSAGVFMLALTREALRSDVNLLQLAYARDLGKPILGVLLGDGVDTRKLPEGIRANRLVDCRNDTRRAGLQLAWALALLPAAGPLPEPLPQPPEAPLWHLRELQLMIDPRSPLDYDRQCVVLVRLQRALRNEETRAEALTLLERMRQRSNLAADTIEEIDVLLTTTDPPNPVSEREYIRPNGRRPAEIRSESRTQAPPPRSERVPSRAGSGTGRVDRTSLRAGRSRRSALVTANTDPADDPNVYLDSDRRLMWTRKDNGNVLTWIRAREYAEELRLSGYSDWRLPTMDELESLYQAASPHPIKIRPPVVLGHRFAWSSEKDDAGVAEGFDFCYGSRKRYYVDDCFLRALCVRDLDE